MSIQVEAILQHLNLSKEEPTLNYLNRILAAWSNRIPWESASRIARHQQVGASENYAWFAEIFFQNAIQYGTGGTCFESNFAFRTLLFALGFECSLHFCDMEKEEPNPHCAVVATVDGKQYIADVGYPISSALELNAEKSTIVITPVYHFKALPHNNNHWEVRRQAGNYESQVFILKSNPIEEITFRARLLQDHEPDGLFLNEVILSRTTNTCMWRYSESKGLVKRTLESEETIELSSEQIADLPSTLAKIFDYDREVIATALNR